MIRKKIERWPDDWMAQAWLKAAFSRPASGACGGPVFGLMIQSELMGSTSYEEFSAWCAIGRMLK